MYKLRSKWFRSHTRHEISNYLDEKTREVTNQMVEYNLYDQPSDEVTYRMSVIGASVSVLSLFRYLLIDSSVKKPWLAKRQVKHKLDMADFKEYISQVVDYLNKQPPSTNYSALVYAQSIIIFLTTMEFNDGPSTTK